jgi:hypothetical protein
MALKTTHRPEPEEHLIDAIFAQPRPARRRTSPASATRRSSSKATSGDAGARARLERQQERAVLAQAEAAYVELVEARREKDAVAANGERLRSAKAEPGKAARRSQIPKPPPFATGSTASRPNDTPRLTG